MDTAQAQVVIFASTNGRGNWAPVPPAEVPEWVKHPDNMQKLVVDRRTCMKCDEGTKGSLWYMALPMDEARRMLKAIAKRTRRAARAHLASGTIH